MDNVSLNILMSKKVLGLVIFTFVIFGNVPTSGKFVITKNDEKILMKNHLNENPFPALK